VVKYIVRRLLWMPVLIISVSFITFVLGLYGPGDPVQMMLGQRANPEAVARLRHELGLDQPLLVQYGKWVWRAVHGDFGTSLKFRGQPVARLMARGLKVTVQLNIAALSLGVFLGIPLGLLAGFKRDSVVDRLIVAAVVAMISIPTFVIAPILLYFFAVTTHLLPPGGWDGIFSTKIILPAIVLGSGPIAILARQTRAAVVEAIASDYVRTAEAKGLGWWRWGRHLQRCGLAKLLIPLDAMNGLFRGIVVSHIFRNALIPIITVIGLMLGSLVSGTFVVEGIFGIPGVGSLAFGAIGSRDYPVMMAFTLMTATAYIMANLAADILYGLADPRVRGR